MKAAAWFITTAALALFAHAAQAQRPERAESLPADAPPGAQACVGCHGTRGEGNAAAGAPRLAGQSAAYLAKQLESYANGSRRDRVMESIARGLAPALRADVAAYYAQTEAPAAAEGGDPPERGRVLATIGDEGLGVQACANCHGPRGAGQPPNIPYLAGLDAKYLGAELEDWRAGTRTNDAGQQMAAVARALGDDDIVPVARYYASLRPPPPAPLDVVQAPPERKPQPPAKPAPVARDPGADQERAGAEQGAPETGGAQGPGGTGETDKEEGDGAPADDASSSGSGQARDAVDASAAEASWPQRGSAGVSTAAAAGDTPSARRGDPQRGRRLVASGRYGCPACHDIPGIRWPRGIVGPPLDGFARRAFIAGQLPNQPDVLAAFVFNAPALIPQTGMPSVGLTLEDARHVAAFLDTLEASDAR